MSDNERLPDHELDDGYKICRREARIMVILWLVQSVIMIGVFLALGYNRTDDPLGYPLGLPGWYLFGGIIPSIVFLIIVIYIVKTRFQEVDLK